jgi:hypothetical protein
VYFVLVLSQTGDEIESHDNKRTQGKKKEGIKLGTKLKVMITRVYKEKKEGVELGTKLKVMITSVHKGKKKRGSKWGRN